MYLYAYTKTSTHLKFAYLCTWKLPLQGDGGLNGEPQ